MKYECYVAHTPPNVDVIDEFINACASDGGGWELFSTIPIEDCSATVRIMLVFRREKTQVL